jgi:glycosyltransferase involved in cell wall biosynthesis
VTERILFVLPSFAGGGAERVIIALANSLDRQIYTPSMVVLEGKGPLASDVDDDIEVIALGRARLRQAIPALRRVILETSPSVVMSTMGYLNLGVLWSVRRHRERFAVVVREANDPDMTFSSLPVPAIGRWLYRWLYRGADCIVAPSSKIGERLAAIVPGATGKIHLLHNPIDEVRIRKAAMMPIRQPGGGTRFAAAGRLSYQKGFDRLLDWFVGLPLDSHLVLLGDGPERPALERRIASLDLDGRVELAGFVANPWAYYAGADAFLLPSRWEGMPNAALEALACGTQVIAMSQAGAVREIANEAPSNTLVIVDTEDDFVIAMRNVVAADSVVLRETLLPVSFTIDRVNVDFQRLIESLSSRKLDAEGVHSTCSH